MMSEVEGQVAIGILGILFLYVTIALGYYTFKGKLKLFDKHGGLYDTNRRFPRKRRKKRIKKT